MELDHQRLNPEDYDRIEKRATGAIGIAKLTGKHLWVAMVAYRVTDPERDSLMLDRENLMVYPHIGCFICEQPFTPRMMTRRCPGDPRG